MNGRASKAKGRRLQNMLRDALREAFPVLDKDDIQSAVMGEIGEDIKFSPLARKHIPFSFECKNVERLNFWKTTTQAESNCREKTSPAIVVKKNQKEPWVAVPMDVFVSIISREVNT